MTLPAAPRAPHTAHRRLRHAGTGLAAVALAASGLVALPPQAHADAKGVDLGRMSDYIKVATSDTSGTVLHNRWLVRVQGDSQADGGTATSTANEQNAVLARARAKGLRISKHRSFSHAFNGMTVTMSTAQAVQLSQVPGVTGIYPVVAVSRPTEPTADSSKDTGNGVDLSGASIARDDMHLSGKGIKVGVIDSGIDIDNPDLGGTGTPGATAFPTSRVKYGYDFVGDSYDSDKTGSVPQPDAVPDDCGGHGTHVAGIIGANGNPAKKGVIGVAPQVTFGAYRVFGCTGTTDSDVILAAMDRAEADGMDVVNMSLGASMMTWADYPTAQASDAMSRDGIVMVTAAGNDGDKGVFTSGAPSVGKDTISVASYNNTRITSNSFTVGSAGQRYGYANAEGSPVAPLTGGLTLAVAGTPGTDAAKGCDDYATTFPAGTAVLVQRGTCSFREKALAAEKAGAAAVILYNNTTGTITPTVEGDPAITIPVVMLSQADGEALASQAGQKLTWSDQTITTTDATGGQVSDFSSWGLSADLSLKPDLGAPGGNIWSTLPLEKGGHGPMSGTSMATPHVAGSVALLLQARPKLKGHPDQVQRLLMNTAVHEAVWSFNPELGLKEPVVRQGAGLIQVDRAILAQQNVTPAKISLGDDHSRTHTTVLRLRNDSAKPVTYTLANQTSIGTLGTSDPKFDLLDANVSMPTTVKVPAHSTKKFTVKITAPADAPEGYLYGGWVVATSTTGATLNVPYVGMAGDYNKVPLLTADGSKAPCLGHFVDGDPTQPACLDEQTGTSYSMGADDQPVAVFRVEYPVQKLEVQVYKANADGTKGSLLGTAMTLDHDGREVGDVGFAWDGTYQTTGRHSYLAKASKGDYVLQVRALHALGKARRAADWETWTSPSFTARFDAAASPQAGTNALDANLVPANR